jgi:hypothetical protein
VRAWRISRPAPKILESDEENFETGLEIIQNVWKSFPPLSKISTTSSKKFRTPGCFSGASRNFPAVVKKF